MTKQQAKLTEILSDLEIKAMMFDMDIDVEALQLMPKTKYKEPIWLTRWKERENGADYDNRLDYDQE